MMRKIITTIIRPKLEYTEVKFSQEKTFVQIGNTEMVPELEDLTCEERLK